MLKKIIATIWFWTGTILATILTGIAVILTMPFCKSGHDHVTYMIENIMARFIYRWMTVPNIWSYERMYENSNVCDQLRTHGKAGPYILASNHASIIDTLFMALLPFKKTYTYNVKWSWVPIFGQMCVAAGYIGIEPNSTSRSNVVARSAEKVEQGYSVMIYPEGTRSHDPKQLLEKLKTGAFRIAKQARRPILPIAFLGTSRAMSRSGIADFADIRCIICAPIEVDDIDQAVDRFREVINPKLAWK